MLPLPVLEFMATLWKGVSHIFCFVFHLAVNFFFKILLVVPSHINYILQLNFIID